MSHAVWQKHWYSEGEDGVCPRFINNASLISLVTLQWMEASGNPAPQTSHSRCNLTSASGATAVFTGGVVNWSVTLEPDTSRGTFSRCFKFIRHIHIWRAKEGDSLNPRSVVNHLFIYIVGSARWFQLQGELKPPSVVSCNLSNFFIFVWNATCSSEIKATK